MAGPVTAGRGMGERRPRPLLRVMIGGVLRRTRLEQRRTLADVSAAARVSVPYLSEVERGRKEASSEVLAAICDALRIGLPDLLSGAVRDLGTVPDLGAARELADGAAGRAGAARPDVSPSRSTGPQAQGPGGAVCLLAA